MKALVSICVLANIATAEPARKPAKPLSWSGTYSHAGGNGRCTVDGPRELHVVGNQVTGVIGYKGVVFGPISFKLQPLAWSKKTGFGTAGSMQAKVGPITIQLPKPRFSGAEHNSDDMAQARRVTAVRIEGYFENRCESPIVKDKSQYGCELNGNFENLGAEADLSMDGLAGDAVIDNFGCNVDYARTAK